MNFGGHNSTHNIPQIRKLFSSTHSYSLLMDNHWPVAICPVLISQCGKVLLAQLPTHAYVTLGRRGVLLVLIFSLVVLY